jgi:ABC-type bacteriocin/lantibiotic exporter with double-glycine peptidase domain
MNDVDLFWPGPRLAEGLEVLARAARLPVRVAESNSRLIDGAPSLAYAASRLGLEVEAVNVSCGEIERLLRSAGPAVIRADADAHLMLLRARRRRLVVVAPDHRLVTVETPAIAAR